MKQSKTIKKRSLVVSIAVLAVCIAALIGATFAWFTDTASTATNKIQAGNLDVDLVMDKAGNGTYTSIADEKAAIFGTGTSLVAQNDSTATIWEPGKTQIVYLGVQNKGNLALKYNIVLTVTGDLAPALEYAIIDGAKATDVAEATSWSDIKTAAGTNTGDVTAGTITAAENGVLDEIINGTQNETDYFALAVHMKEDAGNDYKNKDVSIDVTVNATQAAAESDSFSNEYDKNATYEAGGDAQEEDNGSYLTFSSDAAFSLGGTICVDKLQYSTNKTDWSKFKDQSVAAVKDGDKYFVYLRGDGMTTLRGESCTILSISATDGHTVDCSGNIMTLLDYDNPNGVTMGEYAFAYLFNNCASLASAPSLTAETLSSHCYDAMFVGCSSLTSAPALPATNLAQYCYAYMFQYCTSLTSAPALPATQLEDACYQGMFESCELLKVTEDSNVAGATKIFTCPSTADLYDPVYGMFDCTYVPVYYQYYEWTPEDGHTYYWYTEEYY